MAELGQDLLKAVQEEFQSSFDKSSIISKLYKKVRDGTATYVEANEFALEVGNILAGVYRSKLSSDILPDGRMYYDLAQQIIPPTMINNYNIIADVAQQIQKKLNQSAGIGIQAIKPEINQDRIDGIVHKVSGADDYGAVSWVLDEPVKNFSQSIIAAAIKANAEFQSKAGLQPLIVRKTSGKCCEWCQARAGTYRYPNDVPDDVYKIHRYCRCTVDYDPRSGKVQSVHTKKWKNPQEQQEIEVRKKIGIQDKVHQKEQRLQKATEINKDSLDRMKLDDLRELAKKTAIDYYRSGLSGISFGNTDIEKAAEKLAKNGSRTSLKKDILSMRKKLNY